MQEWAREIDQQLMSSGRLWVMAADGTVGLGMPQLQFVGGGDFASALSEAARAKLAEVRRELREVGAEIAPITPVHRNVPLSAQQPIRESGAALLIGGVSSDARCQLARCNAYASHHGFLSLCICAGGYGSFTASISGWWAGHVVASLGGLVG